MKKVRTVLLWGVTAVVCTLIACGVTVEMFPQPQFTVDLGQMQQDQTVTVYTYHDQGTPFPAVLTGPDSYACDIPQGYWENAYHLEFTVDSASLHVLSASINGKAVRAGQIVNIGEIITSPPYQTTAVIHTSEASAKSIVLFCAILTVLLAVCLIIRREVAASGFGTLRNALLCGGSAVGAIGKNGLLWALAGVLISCAISIGCDINVIVGDMSIVGKGVNIYQYIATMDQRYQIINLMWPYNPPLLIAYFLGTIPLQLGHYAFYGYNIVCYLFYKLLHGGLILVTVVSILSFLEMRGMIAREKCRSVFLWSFFNPLVFYVAVVFIQLDIFPACCLALGSLLFAEKKTPVLSGILLGIGVTCKMQCFLLAPPVLALLLCGVLKKGKNGRIIAWKATGSFAFTLVLYMAPMIDTALPVSLMAQCNPQADRAWWTVLYYTAEIVFQITPAVLICAMIADLVHLDLRKEYETLTLNTLYMFGAITLLFSFSIQSTPSMLIHCLAAFTLLNVIAKDELQRLMIGGLSILIVFEVMFTDLGDITRLLGYAGIPFTFSALEQHLFEAGEFISFFNVLFTISHAAMLAYGVLFCKKAIDTLQSDDGSGCRLMPHIKKEDMKG